MYLKSVATLTLINPLQLSENHSPKSIAILQSSCINSFTLSRLTTFLKSIKGKYVPYKGLVIISGTFAFNSSLIYS